MFSPMIQNLLSSSGEQAAINRYVALHNKVNGFNAAQQAMNTQSGINGIEPPKEENVQSFQNVLKATTKSNFGSLLLNPALNKVQGKIVDSAVDAKNITKSQIMNIISQVSKKHGVDEKLVKALVKQESGFNPQATSHCGAMGLMQLMPATAKGLGVEDAYNPVQNVNGGVKYLKSMLNKYNGNVVLALAAYNAGPGAVDKYDGVPPYKETQNYVKSILANYL